MTESEFRDWINDRRPRMGCIAERSRNEMIVTNPKTDEFGEWYLPVIKFKRAFALLGCRMRSRLVCREIGVQGDAKVVEAKERV